VKAHPNAGLGDLLSVQLANLLIAVHLKKPEAASLNYYRRSILASA
jgi:hypothetical protein